MTTHLQRAPFNDWWYWSESLCKRFRVIARIFRQFDEELRAADIEARTAKLKEAVATPVRHMHPAPKTPEEIDAQTHREEQAIFVIADVFRQTLSDFPAISSVMQDYLSIKWRECEWPKDKSANMKAADMEITELFWGPRDRPEEGIRSGEFQDGGLPGVLYNLLVRERTASNRTPTSYQEFRNADQQQKAATKLSMKMPGT